MELTRLQIPLERLGIKDVALLTFHNATRGRHRRHERRLRAPSPNLDVHNELHQSHN